MQSAFVEACFSSSRIIFLSGSNPGSDWANLIGFWEYFPSSRPSPTEKCVLDRYPVSRSNCLHEKPLLDWLSAILIQLVSLRFELVRLANTNCTNLVKLVRLSHTECIDRIKVVQVET